jgi:hypothetical protein
VNVCGAAAAAWVVVVVGAGLGPPLFTLPPVELVDELSVQPVQIRAIATPQSLLMPRKSPRRTPTSSQQITRERNPALVRAWGITRRKHTGRERC